MWLRKEKWRKQKEGTRDLLLSDSHTSTYMITSLILLHHWLSTLRFLSMSLRYNSLCCCVELCMLKENKQENNESNIRILCLPNFMKYFKVNLSKKYRINNFNISLSHFSPLFSLLSLSLSHMPWSRDPSAGNEAEYISSLCFLALVYLFIGLFSVWRLWILLTHRLPHSQSKLLFHMVLTTPSLPRVCVCERERERKRERERERKREKKRERKRERKRDKEKERVSEWVGIGLSSFVWCISLRRCWRSPSAVWHRMCWTLSCSPSSMSMTTPPVTFLIFLSLFSLSLSLVFSLSISLFLSRSLTLSHSLWCLFSLMPQSRMMCCSSSNSLWVLHVRSLSRWRMRWCWSSGENSTGLRKERERERGSGRGRGSKREGEWIVHNPEKWKENYEASIWFGTIFCDGIWRNWQLQGDSLQEDAELTTVLRSRQFLHSHLSSFDSFCSSLFPSYTLYLSICCEECIPLSLSSSYLSLSSSSDLACENWKFSNRASRFYCVPPLWLLLRFALQTNRYSYQMMNFEYLCIPIDCFFPS